MSFIQRRFKQFDQLKREGIGSLQLRLTLGITAVSLFGLGSVGTWTIWDMQQMLLVKHKQGLAAIGDRFPLGLNAPTQTDRADLQTRTDRWATPGLWIWVKLDGKVVAQSPDPVPPLLLKAPMPSLPEVYALNNQYWMLCSRSLPIRGNAQLYLAQDITHDYTVLSTLINSLRIATIVAIALIGLLVALLIWRSLHPLRRMNRLAAAGMEFDDVPTEVKDLVRAFDHLSVRLSETGAQQRQFTSSMSHELRTSLSLIYGYLQSTLRRGDNLTAPQKNALEVAVGETERTIQLLGTLLDLAKLDLAKINQGATLAVSAKQHALHLVPLQLNEWLRTTKWNVWSDTDGSRLSIVSDSDLPLVVLADAEKLQQVIQHLIDNAAQYSDLDRPITLTLSGDRQEAVIQVRDRGWGIPPDEQSRIFEPFYRLEASRSRATGGMGLGLAIVKSGVESMGGRVTVQSTEGDGSVFEVRLQLINSY